MERRLFLRCLGCGAAVTAAAAHTDLLPDVVGGVQNACAFDFTKKLSEVEARYYKKLENGGVECELCPRHCMVTDLERGYCGVRENRGDVYYTLIYGLPIEVMYTILSFTDCRAPSISIRSRKNPCSIFIPGQTHFPSLPPDVTVTANSVRTGIFPNCVPSRRITSISRPKISCNSAGQEMFPRLPILIPNRLYFMNTCMI